MCIRDRPWRVLATVIITLYWFGTRVIGMGRLSAKACLDLGTSGCCVHKTQHWNTAWAEGRKVLRSADVFQLGFAGSVVLLKAMTCEAEGRVRTTLRIVSFRHAMTSCGTRTVAISFSAINFQCSLESHDTPPLRLYNSQWRGDSLQLLSLRII